MDLIINLKINILVKIKSSKSLIIHPCITPQGTHPHSVSARRGCSPSDRHTQNCLGSWCTCGHMSFRRSTRQYLQAKKTYMTYVIQRKQRKSKHDKDILGINRLPGNMNSWRGGLTHQNIFSNGFFDNTLLEGAQILSNNSVTNEVQMLNKYSRYFS